MPDLGPVVDNGDEQRFELVVDGLTAFAAYQRDGNVIVFTHTEVPPELQGRGVGSALARGALDAARAEGAEVVPLCPFIASYIRRHPEYLDLVTERNRKRLNLERTP
jgi:predicted GNAT family acetyltransferase